MSSGYISPIILTGPFFNDTKLKVNNKYRDFSETSCKVGIGLPKNIELLHRDKKWVLPFEMKIAISLIKEAENEECIQVNLSMDGLVSVSEKAVSISEDEILSGLQLNAISLFYSEARSYIEILTGQSSIGRFTIPAINPGEYLSASSDDDEDEEDNEEY